jgi:hypothetical protein
MDLKLSTVVGRSLLLYFLVSAVGCVAPQTPVPTVWQKLGIPQAGARLRDGLVNRRGNFPGLEKKPPVLALADPANLEPGKPEMIKAAAEIKADQDLKMQKIKALKFLAEVNCGCYNQDDKVEAAFLEALEDCDPEVRTAAISALDTAAGNCPQCCRTGCEVTCCTEKIVAKLQDIAFGTKNGCYKEPVEEIRAAAKDLFCKCPPPVKETPPLDPPEELLTPDPAEPPELREGKLTNRSKPQRGASFSLSDSNRHLSASLVSTQENLGNESLQSIINNPEHLVAGRTIAFNQHLGELLVQLPEAYELRSGWKLVILDREGAPAQGTLVEVGGRRILITLDDHRAIQPEIGDQVQLGVINR